MWLPTVDEDALQLPAELGPTGQYNSKGEIGMRKLWMLVLIGLLALSLVGTTAARTATIASGNFSEPQIMAEAVRILLEQETDYTISHVRNFAGSTLLHSALMAEDVQMYISYTGTQFTGILRMDVTDEWKDRDRVLGFVQTEFDARYDAHWFEPFGFNNTYAVAVRSEFAEEHDLQTVTDLISLAADMTIGMDNTFRERAGDGYYDFLGLYGIDRFGRAVTMDYGLMYRSVASADVDAAFVYSTDGRVPALDLVILEDDMQFFPPYDGSLVASNAFVESIPNIHDILAPLLGTIDDSTIAYYNQLVDVDGMEYYEVAEKLLQDFGLRQ